MKVAVVGAGWAGLAAAVELTGRGAAVTLIEAGRVPGGRARSVEIDGHTLDNGQHILLGAYRETLALMGKVGADPDQLFDRRPLQLLDPTGFRLALPQLPAPLNVAWGLLNATTVDWPEKLKTARWMQGIKWRKFQLPEDCSVAQWLDHAGQNGVLRRHLWEPLCLAALNTPVERASAQLFANVLRDSLGSSHRADTDLLLPRVPFGELLPEPALRWLTKHGATVRFGQRVNTVHSTTVDGESFDAVILAVAPQHAAKLWPAMNTRFDYEPIATVYLQFSAKNALPFPLFNLLGKHGQWVVDRGNGLFACVISGHGEWEGLDDAALVHALHNELKTVRTNGEPCIGEMAAWHKVIREKRATFCGRPQQSRPDQRTDDPRVFLAGDYTWADYPATLEGAVRSGLRAARAAVQACSTPRRRAGGRTECAARDRSGRQWPRRG